jgi:hypothetical protein
MANLQNLKPVQKGQILNPEGRPKGSKNLSTVYREALSAISKDGEWSSVIIDEKLQIATGKDENGKYLYAPSVRLAAWQSIEERLEGKASQTINTPDLKKPKDIFNDLPEEEQKLIADIYDRRTDG